ncbi:uncharacterized protein LOC144127560 [Amblyomma americanum]
MQQTGHEDGMQPELTMASTGGKLPEFDPDSGNLDVFIERFELHITANDVSDAKKLHLFLSAIGEKGYVTLRSLLLPGTPSTSTYKNVVTELQKHYTPTRSVVSERYHFNQKKQGPQESVTDFVVRLKKSAASCDFSSFLEQALRDRLIAGLHSEAIRCRLLAMSDTELTWDRASSIATAVEMAAKDTLAMVSETTCQHSSSGSDIHWQSKSSASPKGSEVRVCSCHAPDKPKPKTSTQRTKSDCHRCVGRDASIICDVPPLTMKHKLIGKCAYFTPPTLPPRRCLPLSRRLELDRAFQTTSHLITNQFC